MFNKLSFLLASLFKIGYAPAAPGTMGSLATIPFAFFFTYYYGTWGVAIAAVVSFIIGVICVREVLKTSRHDPSFVVIDEFSGQMLTFLFVADYLQFEGDNWLLYLLGFMLFRVFDITKPFPVGWADKKLLNAWGVMLDDIFAGLYAGIILYLFNYWINA